MRPYVDFALHCQTFALKLCLKKKYIKTNKTTTRQNVLSTEFLGESCGTRHRLSVCHGLMDEKGTKWEEENLPGFKTWNKEAWKQSQFQSNANNNPAVGCLERELLGHLPALQKG